MTRHLAHTGLRHYDRKSLLAAARRDTMRGRHRRAISIYRQILMEEPHDSEVALKLAPLLASRGEQFEAWRLFSEVGKRFLRARRYEQSLAVFRECCRCLPQQFEAWRIRAEIELKLGWAEAAVETLIAGRHQFRSVHSRAQAIALLGMARALEPWDPAILLDLARLYAQTDQTPQAMEILVALSARTCGRTKRQVRAAQVRLTFSPTFVWRWIQALWGELRGEEAPAPDYPHVTEEPTYASLR